MCGSQPDHSAARQLHVAEADAGAGLLDYLSRLLIYESKARLRRLISQGQILLNGRAVTTGTAVRGGDVIRLAPEVDSATLRARMPAEGLPELEVLHEDEDHVVVNKPAGFTVLPDRAGERAFYDALLTFLNRNAPEGGPYVRPHIVHRLDRETSGVLIVAKHVASSRALALQFQGGQVQKTYLGLVEGVLPRPELHVDIPLRRDPAGELRMIPDQKSGKPSATDLVVREAFGHFSLLEIHPRTGRQHQIRVHLSAIGYPLAVDFLYGRRESFEGADLNAILGSRRLSPSRRLLDRCPLHASAIRYGHPRTGEEERFEVPLPQDLRQFLDVLRVLDPAAA